MEKAHLLLPREEVPDGDPPFVISSGQQRSRGISWGKPAMGRLLDAQTMGSACYSPAMCVMSSRCPSNVRYSSMTSLSSSRSSHINTCWGTMSG